MTVEVKEIKLGSLDAVQVVHVESQASVSVALLGGTLYSYVAGDGKEKLFLSKEAVTDGTKPLRGGVPLVFPQFGAGPLPNHGFARTSLWSLGSSAQEVEAGVVELSFTLSHSDATKAVWPFEFALEHVIRFGKDTLQTRLQVKNIGEQAFPFQMLLHTYYSLGQVEQVEVSGLQGLRYVDQLQESQAFTEEREVIAFAQETDAIYSGAASPVTITDKQDGSRIEITASLTRESDVKSCDVVVWNPWIEKSKRTGDFGDEEYHNMVCIEPGCVSRFETCAPQETWALTQQIQFSS